MNQKRRRAFGPSRENEVRYSRTYAMYLVPLAVVFTIAWCAALAMFTAGIFAADGERIIAGGFIVLFGSVICIAAWRNACGALRDRRIQKRQLKR